MNCPLVFIREDGDQFIHGCPECGSQARSKYCDPAMRSQKCGVHRPPGPGTHLWWLLKEIDVRAKRGCQCFAIAKEMNAAGVAGCREHRDYFLAKLRENAKAYGLADWAAAGWNAVWQGKPITLAGLFDLAIHRASGPDTLSQHS
jgi:hypothetical protein